MVQKIDFPVKKFEELPDSLPTSDYIEFLLLIAKLKPALRVNITDEATRKKLNAWCKNYNLFFLYNGSGYVCIATDQIYVNRLQKTDDSFKPHEYELGYLLGYPQCCCKNISYVGEKNIDEWENEFIRTSKFEGEFELINPKGHREGYALISHIPCSSNCEQSLYIAKKALNIITCYKNYKYFDKWKYWRKNN